MYCPSPFLYDHLWSLLWVRRHRLDCCITWRCYMLKGFALYLLTLNRHWQANMASLLVPKVTGQVCNTCHVMLMVRLVSLLPA